MAGRQQWLQREVGYVLDVDPDLGRDISAAEWKAARDATRGRLLSLSMGRWDLAHHAPGQGGATAFLIVDGLVCREIQIRDHHLIELLGPGDILPARPTPDDVLVVGAPIHTVLRETRVLALGRAFIRSGVRWPSLMTAAFDRIEQQRQRLAVQSLIVHLRRAEDRVLLMLWHLTLRWGHVTPDGVHLPFRLTHDLLGQLIASERSTVSLAIGHLVKSDRLRRLDDGTWLLTPDGQAAVQTITATQVRPVGSALLRREQSDELILDGGALQVSGR
jgi:CRP/FNR family transcriptional regulator, cyclic AMP receptor protein